MEGIIFDADYTLYRPEADRAYDRKFAFLAEQTGVEADELASAWEDVIESKEGDGLVHRKMLIRRMLEEVGVEPAGDLVDQAYGLFWDTVVDDLTYDQELPEMLERLDQRFELLAIATDEFPEALEMKLSTVFDSPEDLFDDVVTPEDVGDMKPSEEFYRQILESHSIPPGEAVMVGDSWERDLEPAESIGMTTVLVDSDRSGEPMAPDRAENARPDHRIDRITELEEILEVGT